LLNLKVAKKDTKAGYVPMAGFPCFQLNRYLKILVQDHNRFVAISEEFPRTDDDKSNTNLFSRKIARVISPGTLVDEDFMDPYIHNYLLAISFPQSKEEPIGLAWIDLSTGDFFTQASSIDAIKNDIARISPREVLLMQELQDNKGHELFDVLEEREHVVTYLADKSTDPSLWQKCISDAPADLVKSFSDAEQVAATNILSYAAERLQDNFFDMQIPIRRTKDDSTVIDLNSMRALELKQTYRDQSTRGSLMSIIKRTVTKSGTRLLSDRLLSPITSVQEINKRLDLVEVFVSNASLRGDIVASLRRCHDTQRICQKFAFARGDADDLLALARTIKAAQDIRDKLQMSGIAPLQEMAANMEITIALAEKINNTVDEESLHKKQRSEEDAAALVVQRANIIVENAENGAQEEAIPRRRRGESEDFWIMRKS